MSSFAEHEAEQSAITAACEAGTCDHPDCKAPASPFEVAHQIIDTTSQSEDSNVRRAARAFLTVAPSYDDDTLETGITDLLTDLRHLCELSGYEWVEVVKGSERQYRDELAECGGPARHDALKASIEHHME